VTKCARACDRDREVGDGDQAAAAAEGRALHARDHGLGAAIDRAEHRGHRLRIAHVLVFAQVERIAHPRDVGTAAERLARAGQHDRANAAVVAEADERLMKRGDQLRIEGIPDVGPIDDDACVRPLALDANHAFRHGCAVPRAPGAASGAPSGCRRAAL
jgi:hypothetical protein